MEPYESVNNFYPPHKILETLAVSGFVTLATIASSVAVALPASAISFNLSFTTDDDSGNRNPLTVNALLTTSDNSPTAIPNNTYTLTGISGTANGRVIIGLGSSSNIPGDNIFRWDGTTIIGVTINGISFDTPNDVGGLASFTLVNNSTGSISEFNPSGLFTLSDGIGEGGNVISLSLTPVAATPVPFDFDPNFGLLALGGVWAARKMIKKSKSVVNK
jgi:hypothetical protein